MTTPRGLAALPPLSAGAHEHVDEGACLMEAVSYVAGEPWSDKPTCACPVLGAFLRTWNDHCRRMRTGTASSGRLSAPGWIAVDA